MRYQTPVTATNPIGSPGMFGSSPGSEASKRAPFGARVARGLPGTDQSQPGPVPMISLEPACVALQHPGRRLASRLTPRVQPPVRPGVTGRLADGPSVPAMVALRAGGATRGWRRFTLLCSP